MKKTGITTRVALTLAMLSANALLIGQLIGLLPDEQRIVVRGRIALCESIAMSCSTMVHRGEIELAEQYLSAIATRNAEVRSLALRRDSGQVLLQIGNHNKYWLAKTGQSASNTNIYVPIASPASQWGTLEVAFLPIGKFSIFGFQISKFMVLLAFVTAFDSLVFVFFLSRVLAQLDPSKVVPQRVRSALDTLAEGLLVLDDKSRIVLANKAFADTVGQSADVLQGRHASDFDWSGCSDDGILPWCDVSADGSQQVGVPVSLKTANDERTFMVNTTPIRDEKGHHRGILASFDDVTILENKKAELVEMLSTLERSRDKIRQQNDQLQILATQDPLTSCLNRRAFFEQFEDRWESARLYNSELSCIMVDVDHFKQVNDNHGHAKGDEVLKKVAGALRNNCHKSDLVCRYGGEEFCIVLSGADLDKGTEVAERLRSAIEALVIPGLSVTASLGISSIRLGADGPHDLLNQADNCLYTAKETGRNRTVRWDQVPVEAKTTSPAKVEKPDDSHANAIPFHAVTALLSALTYRDQDTASHCARVADLCVMLGREMMSARDTYVLEVAGLLHDIGKIGVPDAILLKPGSLTDEEWEVMHLHDRIGVEIIAASFACPLLIEAVSNHHSSYGGKSSHAGELRGKDIPLNARILAIADAYDSMVSDRVYRKALPREVAFAELRRCSGTQFDPDLAEKFITLIGNRPDGQQRQVQQGSKKAALQIGLQIERLADAVDQQDLSALSALAGRLHATAAKVGMPDIEQLAAELLQFAEDDPDLPGIVRTTIDLIDLCWSMQRAHVQADVLVPRSPVTGS